MMTKEQTSKQSQREEEQDAERAVAQAQKALREAADAAAEAGQGLAAVRMRNVPDMTVEVNPGHTVAHEGVSYYGEGYVFAPEDHEGNDTLELPGPVALALVQNGAVTIKGTK